MLFHPHRFASSIRGSVSFAQALVHIQVRARAIETTRRMTSSCSSWRPALEPALPRARHRHRTAHWFLCTCGLESVARSMRRKLGAQRSGRRASPRRTVCTDSTPSKSDVELARLSQIRPNARPPNRRRSDPTSAAHRSSLGTRCAALRTAQSRRSSKRTLLARIAAASCFLRVPVCRPRA